MSKYLGKYEVADPARPWYDLATLKDAIADGRTKVEEWSYADDPHYYCHERPDLALLVEAADASQQKDEQLRELLSRCRHGEEFEDWPASSVYGDIADKLAAIPDGER